MDETADLIDSPPFSHVLTLLLDAGFSLLVDSKIATAAYKIPPTSAALERVHELVGTDKKTKLANCLAVFARQAHAIGASGSNEYLAAMAAVRDLDAFAAVVYSSNFEFEAPDFTATSSSGGEQGGSAWGTSAVPTPAARAVPDESAPAGLEGEMSLIESREFQKAWEQAEKASRLEG
jgi:peroxin-3